MSRQKCGAEEHIGNGQARESVLLGTRFHADVAQEMLCAY
jgi:hypothetical protein